MGKTFTLIDVVQEPLWYPDDHYGGDGTRYEVRTADLLGAEDYARYLWHQEEARRASATLARRDADKEARVAAGRTLEQVVNEQIAIIIPKLSGHWATRARSWSGGARSSPRWRHSRGKRGRASG
jgi:hypothetical protein